MISLYKLLAKVLANKSKKMVGEVVSCFKNAFVEGVLIFHMSLIVNEAIDSIPKTIIGDFYVSWI